MVKLKEGDLVRVEPSRPGVHNGFIGRVVRLDGAAVHLSVQYSLDGTRSHSQRGKSRVVWSDQIRSKLRKPPAVARGARS
jgi:hypothetical protein